jgi:transcriptional regulator with XRE-family HTH domain
MPKPGTWFVNRRQELGLTQKQVADYVGVNSRTVQYWENDGRSPKLTLSQVVKLCQILQCSVEQLARDFQPEEFEENAGSVNVNPSLNANGGMA